MLKKSLLFLLIASAMVSGLRLANAHCQVPCGIYEDHARVHRLLEDASTIHKACVKIAELSSKNDAQSQQQLVRWVNTKESHAQKIIRTLCDYYLTQRVKPSQVDYVERLQHHHAVIVAAMKTKQGVQTQAVDVLIETIEALMVYYPHH